MVSAEVAAIIRDDPFARMLGVVFEEIGVGYARVSMVIKPEHQNFHGMTHGGIVFSLGDIAFAAAGNGAGRTAVALNVDINFLQGTAVDDTLIAEARELSANGPIALYEISVSHGHNKSLIAKSQAILYRKKEKI